MQHFKILGTPDHDIVAALKTPGGESFPFAVSPRLAASTVLRHPGRMNCTLGSVQRITDGAGAGSPRR